MAGKYVLRGKVPVEVENLLVWAAWIEGSDRHVALTPIRDDMVISTIFLGLDMAVKGPPMLFETMVFAPPEDATMWGRCSTWDQAETMHQEAVKYFTRKMGSAGPTVDPREGG